MLWLVVIGNIFGDAWFVSEVFAQASTASEKELALAANLQLVIRLIYLLMRPLVAIVGATLDNSMVMWEVFFLNVSIYSMRQIMRNFANFALGGIFLFALLRNVFTAMSGNDDYINGTWGIKSLLPKMLLGAILIQSSFFMMSVLIDFSTIGIYSLWTLPINTVMSASDNPDTNEWWLKNVYFLKPNIKYQLDNSKAAEGTNSTFSIFYGCPWDPAEKKNYIACEFQASVLLPKLWDEDKPNTWENHKKIQATTRANLTNAEWKDWKTAVQVVQETINDDFCVFWNSLLEMEDFLWKPVNQCTLKKMREDKEHGEGKWVMATKWCPTLASFMDSAAWMTWPMYGLYASILRMDQMGQTENTKDTIELSLDFLVKLAVSVSLIIPLIALAIAMMIRLVALWWFIIFSPLLVLGRVFFSEKIEAEAEWKASFSSLIGLIFMPVLVVFAVSIGLIFMTLIARQGEFDFGPDQSISSKLWYQYNAWISCTDEWESICEDGEVKDENWFCKPMNVHCYDLAGITSLCFTESQKTIWNGILNVFSYLLVSFFGIAMMWMIVFAAMRSSKITAGVTEKVKDLWQSLAKSVPIVPLAGWLSYGDIANTSDSLSRIPQQIANNQNQNLNKHFDRMRKKKAASGSDFQKWISDSVKANDAAAATTALEKGIWSNQSIDDFDGAYNAMWLAAGIANPESVKSLKDLVKNKKWYNWLRTYQNEQWDVWKAVWALNTLEVEGQRIKLDSKHFKQVSEWMATLANTTGSWFKDLGDGKYYHKDPATNLREYITITDSWISSHNISTIKDALKDNKLTVSSLKAELADLNWAEMPDWLKAIKTNRPTWEYNNLTVKNIWEPVLGKDVDLATVQKWDLLIAYNTDWEIIKVSEWTKVSSTNV